MPTTTENPQAALRWSVYWILIFLSAGVMLGRILAVDAVDRTGLEKDRIAHLDRDLYMAKQSLEKKGLEGEAFDKAWKDKEEQIRRDAQLRRPFLSANDRSRWCAVRALVEPEMRVEGFPYAIDKVIQEPGWDTIDMVKHNDHLYSSKPPLYPTLLAGIYWAIYHTTGMTLGTHPFVVGRIVLILVNLLPLVAGMFFVAKLAERFGTTDWAKIFVVAAAAFGTFLTTFAVVVNNHVTAAVCCAAFLYCAALIWFDGERRMRYFFFAGLSGAFLAANELPALSLVALVGLALAIKAPKPFFAAFLPATVLVAVPFFATNYIAHGTVSIPYAHRNVKDDNWYDYDYMRNGRLVESFWRDPTGYDQGEKSISVYTANVLVGHHGIFSLTPIWLLAVFGVGLWIFKSPDWNLRGLGAAIGLVSIVCIVFYINRPSCDRNYGGMTSGFRWVFWMAPMWLLAILPAADIFARSRLLKALALLLLALSAFSAAYPIWNPWTNPWIVDLMQYISPK
jgi:hypothetical protein